MLRSELQRNCKSFLHGFGQSNFHIDHIIKMKGVEAMIHLDIVEGSVLVGTYTRYFRLFRYVTHRTIILHQKIKRDKEYQQVFPIMGYAKIHIKQPISVVEKADGSNYIKLCNHGLSKLKPNQCP